MPVILSLETSAEVCSVALHNGDRLLAEAILREPQAHAAKLAPLIHQVMGEGQTDLARLNAVAVSMGPGSYTGLRIGTSTAKGLCYALDIPLIGVGTLDLLAYQGKAMDTTGALLCPMIDARRMEVYCTVTDALLNVVEPVSAKIIQPDSFQELLSRHRVLFFGDGAMKCSRVIKSPNAVFMEGVFPTATALGEIARDRFASGLFEDLVHFKPFYLKEFTAKKSV